MFHRPYGFVMRYQLTYLLTFLLTYCADPPSMKCVQSVATAVDKSDVRLVCHVTSDHPLTDARVTWDVERHLQPIARPGLPPGVMFDGDGEYLAYLRQVRHRSDWKQTSLGARGEFSRCGWGLIIILPRRSGCVCYGRLFYASHSYGRRVIKRCCAIRSSAWLSVPVFDSVPFAGWRCARVADSSAFVRGQHGRLCPRPNAIGVGRRNIVSPRDTLL